MADLFEIRYFTNLFIVFTVIFLLREYFSFRRILTAKYVLTPMVTMSIIMFGFISLNATGVNRYSVLILAGLLLSMVADTLLMIEEISFFKLGLIFFLLAHCAYIGALSLGYRFQPWNIIVAALFIVLIGGFYWVICRSYGEHHPWVLLYMVVLAVMCFIAYSYMGIPGSMRAVLLPVGSTLFFISDGILAVNTFVKKIPHSTVLTWSLYAPAQFFIVLSCFFS